MATALKGVSQQGTPTLNVKDLVDRFIHQIENLNIRFLQPLYLNIVEEIFGLRNKSGFKLNDIEYYTNPVEYDALFKFLHPEGPFFRLCHKLIFEVNAHYEYPIHDLPHVVQQEIKCLSSCSSYYRHKLHFREGTMEPAFFLLNPFEYYMFYFIVSMVLFDKRHDSLSLLKDRSEIHRKSTLYLRLCEEYVSVFLPLDNSPVKPVIKCPIRIHVGDKRTILPRTSTILRTDLVSRLLDTHDTCESPVEDIWRSYLVAHVAIDFWGIPPSERNQIRDINYDTLPSASNICAYRYLLKHLHLFSNSAGPSNSKMDEFKRGAIALFQPKIYTFLKGTMLHWPHDSSFSLILETWLTFIQPWRYAPVVLKPQIFDVTDVPRRWMKFISDNFLFYTLIFQLVLKRFENLNLILQKNITMVLRVLKVYAKTNLSMMIEEIEQRYITEYNCEPSKWAESITNHICTVEAADFMYIPLFSAEYFNELKSLLEIIYDTREEAYIRVQLMKPTMNNKKSWLKRFFSFGTELASEEDLKGDYERLSAVLQLFALLFHAPQEVLEEEISSKRGFVKNDSIKPIKSDHIRLNQSFNQLKNYHGNPDIQPIQSFEIGILVKIFYKISTGINEQYGDVIVTACDGGGYYSRFIRSLLAAPQEVCVIDKENGIVKPILIKKVLPHRVSLRILAHQLVYVYFGIFTVLCLMAGIPLGVAYAYIIFIGGAFLLIRPIFTSQ